MTKLNPQYINYIIMAILVIILVIFAALYFKKAGELHQAEYNITALTDSITVGKNKAKEIEFSQAIFMADYKTLKKLNGDLVKEIDKSSKKHLAEINKLGIMINNLKDSIKIVNSKLVKVDTIAGAIVYTYQVSDSTAYRIWEGNAYVTATEEPKDFLFKLTQDKIYTDIVIRKYIDKDQIKLTVSSSNPGLVVDKIEGSILDISEFQKLAKKKKFSVGIGIHVGVGAVGIIENKSITHQGFGPYAGIGLNFSYKLFDLF